ncbi:hypothetical protein [Nocardia altamirensis]|uniref:hypothetical protein n=1 Tax=Nocardia altamirensis TaxID=472158 RepID=UPI00114C9F60|nr:hypothetical protein [Nocardia altamirensis]
MELDTETYCRGCGAPLAWRLTRTTARLLPLDVWPCEQGRVRVYDNNSATVLTGGELLLTRAQGVALYAHHVAGQGCPDVWPADAGRVAAARLIDSTVLPTIAQTARSFDAPSCGRPAPGRPLSPGRPPLRGRNTYPAGVANRLVNRQRRRPDYASTTQQIT